MASDLAERVAYDLHVAIFFERMDAAVTAKAGLAEAAERHSDVAAVPTVDPYHARYQRVGKAVRPVHAGRPEPCRKAVARAVGNVQRFIVSVECGDAQQWTENLLLRQWVVGRHIGNDRGQHIVAACICACGLPPT